MRSNMKHAITVKECSQVVENAHLNNRGFGWEAFATDLTAPIIPSIGFVGR